MQVKVYYADTDAGGVVYYANYLRWLEMARTELFEKLGFSVAELARDGIVFPVARLEIDYLGSAILGDVLEVETRIARVRHVRFFANQKVFRAADGTQLVDSTVTMACIEPTGKLQTIPAKVGDALRELL